MSLEKPLEHVLVPKHEIVAKAKVPDILSELRATPDMLPKIKFSDPALAGAGAKPGDLVKITRSEITGENIFYRIVIR